MDLAKGTGYFWAVRKQLYDCYAAQAAGNGDNNITHLVKETPSQLGEANWQVATHQCTRKNNFHRSTLDRFNAVALVDSQSRMLDRTRIFGDRTDDCLVEKQ